MWSGQMIEPLAVTVEELATLCDVVSGQRLGNLDADKKPSWNGVNGHRQ
jgi:hypothetical protein